MYRNKKTGSIGIVVTIILLTLLVFLTNVDINKASYVESALSKLVMPIQNGMTYLKNKIAGNSAFFEDINNLKTENENLKTEIATLEKDLRELEIIKAENNTLRGYVNLKDQYSEYETVPAYIINKDISNLSDTLVINVGTENGVNANMAVIAAEGLVGYVVSSTSNTSKVQPIIDSACSVSAMMSTSRDNVILKGILDSENTLKATYVATDADLMLEDNVETSGLGEIYPKGIKIGTLKEIIETKNITDRYAIIETAVDFSELETVLVVIK